MLIYCFDKLHSQRSALSMELCGGGYTFLLLLVSGVLVSASNAWRSSAREVAKIRKHRRQIGAFFDLLETNCETNCEAQFRRDFQDLLGKSYDTEFFDFPIDPLISASRKHFDTFCQLVEERMSCYRGECDVADPPQTPQTHICLQQRQHFEASLECLNKTATRLKCHSLCAKAARHSIREEDERRHSARDADGSTGGNGAEFTDFERRNYEEQDLRCRFQACTLECRRQLIGLHCTEREANLTCRTIGHYYTTDLALDLQQYQVRDALQLFPKFCRSWLAIETNNADTRSHLRRSEAAFNHTMNMIHHQVARAISNANRTAATSPTREQRVAESFDNGATPLDKASDENNDDDYLYLFFK